jgi:ABC-type polysaccharide/polyol phosphate transport system ATPase subunit/glycosyltransferase involved in cell wall biosynthesis
MTHAVVCEDLWKSYRQRRPVGLRGRLLGGVPRDTRFARHWALSGVNFIVTRGQALGVIGPNGSGKTTLLAILLGAILPDRGRAALNGRTASLLELGAGFQGHLTGRENVYLYGSILGMTLDEIRSRYGRIAEFSEMGASLDRPLRRYSAGMIARLRFSVIIHSPAEILLIDEVLTVGDARFQHKCLEALRQFKGRGGTLILVSHDMEEIASLCDDAIFLDFGSVVDAGPARQVAARYLDRTIGPGQSQAQGLNARISLLLPTRGRPELLRRFLESVLARSERPELVEVVVYADVDDPSSHGFQVEGLEVRTIVGPRASMGDYNTACLEGSRGDIVVLANDDVVIQTRGWDRKLREMHAAMQDRVYLAYPNDLFKGRGLSAFPILSRTTCRLLGEPFPHAYRGAFIDYHLLDIFKRLERHGHFRLIYLEDVVFEHMHYRTGKGDFDEIYGKRDRFGDDDTFIRMRDERNAAAQRLLAAIEGEAARRPLAAAAPTPPELLKVSLLDRELPLSWRLRLFLWFLARSLARLVLGRGREARA